MKLQYLGTAAAEGIPGLFCNCPTCEEARKRAGRNFRSRSQALIDDQLLVDFPSDTFMHCLQYGINLTKIKHCLITHTHGDHLYLNDLARRLPGFSSLGRNNPITFYGLAGAMKTINGFMNGIEFDTKGIVEVKPLNLYETAEISAFKVTPLKALHDPAAFPAIYIIENREGKRMLYAHDTNYFCDETWDYFKNNPARLDFVSLDCTEANTPFMKYVGHMNLKDNIAVKNRLLELGCADENTLFCLNHFSHNGTNVLYEDFSKIAKAEGFLISYDGMEIDF